MIGIKRRVAVATSTVALALLATGCHVNNKIPEDGPKPQPIRPATYTIKSKNQTNNGYAVGGCYLLSDPNQETPCSPPVLGSTSDTDKIKAADTDHLWVQNQFGKWLSPDDYRPQKAPTRQPTP